MQTSSSSLSFAQTGTPAARTYAAERWRFSTGSQIFCLTGVSAGRPSFCSKRLDFKRFRKRLKYPSFHPIPSVTRWVLKRISIKENASLLTMPRLARNGTSKFCEEREWVDIDAVGRNRKYGSDLGHEMSRLPLIYTGYVCIWKVKCRRADSFGLDSNHCDVIQFFNIYFIWLKQVVT